MQNLSASAIIDVLLIVVGTCATVIGTMAIGRLDQVKKTQDAQGEKVARQDVIISGHDNRLTAIETRCEIMCRIHEGK